MNQTAVISDSTYHLLETIPGLDGEKFVLCESENGERLICPLDRWEAAAPTPTTKIHAKSSSQEKIALFLELFHGRDDVYAKRWYNYKTQKAGYAPACRNEWVRGVCDKKKQRCADCPNREFVPLNSELIRAHLIGRDEFCRDVVGIYPLLPDDRTWLLCADFDDGGWQEDVVAFCEAARNCGLTPAVERSRSGEGAHVWFFFAEPVSATDARKLGSLLLTQTMAKHHELSFRSYDRLFPSQDTMPKGGFGNLIALPFQGQAQKNRNRLYVEKTGLSQNALNRIKRLAAFRNPDFYKSQAMRLPIYDKHAFWERSSCWRTQGLLLLCSRSSRSDTPSLTAPSSGTAILTICLPLSQRTPRSVSRARS